MVWKVGTGDAISFWFDNWIGDQSLAQLLDIEDISLFDPNTKVSEFIQNAQWDMHKLNHTVHNHHVIQQVLGIALPIIDTRDSFCWGHSGSGEFSTKVATWLAHGHQVHYQPDWQFKWVWHIDTMPKIQVFLWQLCHNALLVRGTLFRRGCNIEPQCPLCAMDMESTDHLF